MRIRGRVTAVIGLSSSSRWRQNKGKGDKKRKEVLINDRVINPGVGPLECFTGDEVPTLPTPLTSLIGQFPDTGDGGGLTESTVYFYYVGCNKYLDIRSDKNIYVSRQILLSLSTIKYVVRRGEDTGQRTVSSLEHNKVSLCLASPPRPHCHQLCNSHIISV